MLPHRERQRPDIDHLFSCETQHAPAGNQKLQAGTRLQQIGHRLRGWQHLLGLLDIGKIDEVGRVTRIRNCLDGDPRFADAARTGQGDRRAARTVEELPNRFDLTMPSNKRGSRRGDRRRREAMGCCDRDDVRRFVARRLER
jgi:hypothetical protein